MGKSAREKRTRQADPAAKRSPSRPLITFASAFLGLFLAFQLAYYALIVQSPAFGTYLGWNTRAAAVVLGLLGESVTATDDSLSSTFTMSVKSGCDGLQVMAILAIAVLVFPGGGWGRLVATGLGVAFLAALNLLRLVSLFLAGVHAPGVFQTMHVHVWPAILIVVALVYAFAWMAWAKRRARTG